ncbi:MAG: hypothetical protein E7360_03375 [Clostridiales bacterium]|nr:hypothetical protein [Clostridiales bacterium]
MKKLLNSFLAIVLAFSLCGCSNKVDAEIEAITLAKDGDEISTDIEYESWMNSVQDDAEEYLKSSYEVKSKWYNFTNQIYIEADDGETMEVEMGVLAKGKIKIAPFSFDNKYKMDIAMKTESKIKEDEDNIETSKVDIKGNFIYVNGENFLKVKSTVESDQQKTTVTALTKEGLDLDGVIDDDIGGFANLDYEEILEELFEELSTPGGFLTEFEGFEFSGENAIYVDGNIVEGYVYMTEGDSSVEAQIKVELDDTGLFIKSIVSYMRVSVLDENANNIVTVTMKTEVKTATGGIIIKPLNYADYE